MASVGTVLAGAITPGRFAAFGREANPIYQFDKADVILSLDADFLYSGPGAVR